MRFITLSFIVLFSPLGAFEKLYFDHDEMPKNEDAFHIHVGNNIWLETSTIHRDAIGFYTYTTSIRKIGYEYERKWKCPYCYMYWPEGVACQNPKCPSKY